MKRSQLKQLGVRLPPKSVEGPSLSRDPVSVKPKLPKGLSQKLNLPKLDLLPNKSRR